MNRMACFLLTMVLSVTGFGWQGPVWAEPVSARIDLEQVQVLDLATASKIALAENPTLDVAQARLDQAREALNQARAAYWPRLDLSASGTRVELSDTAYQSQSALYRALGTTVEDPQDYYRAGLAANWVLFDGFARKFNVAAATYGEQSAAAARDDVRRLLLQAVTSAFLSAQLSLENISIAKADEAFNRRQLTESKLRYEVGTGALSDMLNFEVRVNTAQSDLIAAERAYQTDRIALAALLGVPHARLPEHTQLAPLEAVTPERLEKPDFGGLLDVAYAQRPDLTQSDRAIQQAEADVQTKKANYYPTVSLFASYDGERTDDLGFENQDFGNSVGINLSYNLFAGGLYQAQHQQARARLREAEKSRENAKIGIASQVQTTIEMVLSAQKQLLLQRTNAELVQKNRDLVEKEYKAGVGSLVRLNEAQRDLTAAQVRLALAQTAVHRAWYDLWSATGQILTKFTP
jgi:TolC family type I secretion outer membrane protein